MRWKLAADEQVGARSSNFATLYSMQLDRQEICPAPGSLHLRQHQAQALCILPEVSDTKDCVL